MRSSRWRSVPLALALLVAASSRALALDPSMPESARGEVKKSLESGGYDWYDPATDGPNYERLAHELDDPDAAAKKWRWLAWVLDAVALSVLLAIIVYVIRAARRARLTLPRRETRPEPEVPPATLPLEDPSLGFDPGAWLEAADQAAARGDYARAIVCLFNGQLLLLDRSHAIRLGPGRTNRQHLAEITAPDPGRESFSSSIQGFERVFYGGRPATRESFDHFQADHRCLLASLESTGS
jgi:hypothetical protein